MNWIKCSDRTPDNDVQVIVYCAHHRAIGFGYRLHNLWFPLPVFDEVATDYYDTAVADSFAPSHWMPLPEPPISERVPVANTSDQRAGGSQP